MESTQPKVFISYSWDDESHRKWVLHLANKLVVNGVDIRFDQYDLTLGKDLLKYMEKSLNESNLVIIIMTPNYKIKSESRLGGVGYECNIITAEIFKDSDTRRFIPILRKGSREQSAPTFIKNRIDLDMSDDDKFEIIFQELLRSIYNEPEIKKPPLGKKPNFECVNQTKEIGVGINMKEEIKKDIKLTPVECKILQLMVNGESSRNISNELCLTQNTIQAIRKRILIKFDAKSTVEMVSQAISQGFVKID